MARKSKVASEVERRARQENTGLEGARYYIGQISARAREIAERIIGTTQRQSEPDSSEFQDENTEITERHFLARRNKVRELSDFLAR